MVINDFRSLAPYFRNGLLYFPEKTVTALLEVGLDWHVGHRAISGVSLDEHDCLEQISESIDVLLSHVDVTSPFFDALLSDDAYFMLTGKPLFDTSQRRRA